MATEVRSGQQDNIGLACNHAREAWHELRREYPGCRLQHIKVHPPEHRLGAFVCWETVVVLPAPAD